MNNKKSKYYWGSDVAHGTYLYNDKNSWKGLQLEFLFEFIKNNFKFSDGTKCLDIGCNAGLNLKTFKEKYDHVDNKYIGFDLNDTALTLARQNLPDGEFKKCNFLLENPIKSYSDDSFDICFSTWVLTHLNISDERENLIKDMVRTSKRGIIYEAYAEKCGLDYPPKYSEKSKPDNFNVVVYDDYRRYSNLIMIHELQYENCSKLYYWDKT
jgi:ubiquinone/menaquinone biosynthesis C-methylase UbiE